MTDTVPHNDQAERAVLGALLTGAPIADDLADVLAGRDFYQPRHETIYDACLAVHRAGQKIDVPLVAAKVAGDVDALYLAELIGVDVSPNPWSAKAYADLVVNAALGRRLVEAGQRIVQQAATGGSDMVRVAEDARKVVDDAAASAQTAGEGRMAGDLLFATLDKVEGPLEEGVATPWPDVDDIVRHLLPGQLVVIGARPGMGKSVVGANLAATASQAGVGTYFASLEMTSHEVMCRMVAATASVDLSRVMHHRLESADWDKIANRTGSISEWPLIVDDTAPLTFQQLRARLRSAQRKIPLGLVVVDYLQLMAPRDRSVPREQQVGELSESLKMLAKELSVPVVALAQLNRAGADGKPRISDLRESGRLEQDADQVWLLHREDAIDPDSATGEIDVDIAKNRNGTTRKVSLGFQGHYSRCVSLAV